jgi:hypothetical protein
MKGVQCLMPDGRVIEPQSAEADTPVDETPRIVSYRHSIRGAQILLALDDSAPEAVKTVGRMLSESPDWQAENGGWRQCETTFRRADLWASAYAIGILDYVIRFGPHLLQKSSVERVEARIERTIDFLQAEWDRSKWAYSKASAAQNAVLVFHEVCVALELRRQAFWKEVKDWLSDWISDVGRLDASYLEACTRITTSSASARVAYALYLAGEHKCVWSPLLEDAIREFSNEASSADAAFMLDLLFSL